MVPNSEGTKHKDSGERSPSPTDKVLGLDKIRSMSSPRSSQEIMSQQLGAMAFSKDAEIIKNVKYNEIFERIQKDLTSLGYDEKINEEPNPQKIDDGYWRKSILLDLAFIFLKKTDNSNLDVPKEIADFMHDNILTHFSENEAKYIKNHAKYYYRLEHENRDPNEEWENDLEKCINDYSQSGLNDRIKRISKDAIKILREAMRSSEKSTNRHLAIHKNIVENCKIILANCININNVMRESFSYDKSKGIIYDSNLIPEAFNNLRKSQQPKFNKLKDAVEVVNEEIKLKRT